MEVPTFFHKAPGHDPSETTLDLIIRTLDSRLNRDRDLFHETPAEFHLITISPERHIVGWLMHHVAGDAATGTDVGQETLANYHEIIRGSKPNWAEEYYSISGSRKRRVSPKKLTIRNYLEDVRQTFQNVFKRPCLPVGSGLGQDRSQHHVKRILTEEETDLLYKTTTNHGVSLVDRFVVCANGVIDEWNLQRGLSPGLLTASMTVNMRGRFSDVDSMNSSSLIFFKSITFRAKRYRRLCKESSPNENKTFSESNRPQTIQKYKNDDGFISHFPLSSQKENNQLSYQSASVFHCHNCLRRILAKDE